MPYRVILHRDTLGVTQPALQALRNELAARITHDICVIEVPAAEGHCDIYGFFIVDETTHSVIIIGDGFRGDGRGEGGTGHRAAQALLAIYGIHGEQALESEAISYVDDESAYSTVADKMAAIAKEMGFVKLNQQKPRYPDWVYARR